MENLLETQLGYSSLKKIGSGGGCINQGIAYETDQGKIYVKYNSNSDVSFSNTKILMLHTNLFVVCIICLFFEWKEGREKYWSKKE